MKHNKALHLFMSKALLVCVCIYFFTTPDAHALVDFETLFSNIFNSSFVQKGLSFLALIIGVVSLSTLANTKKYNTGFWQLGLTMKIVNVGLFFLLEASLLSPAAMWDAFAKILNLI